MDLERRMWDIAMSQGGKKIVRAFMCKTPKGISHLMRQLVAMTCRCRGFRARVRWLMQEAWG